ncbi:OmpA family protein [Sphingomonas sp. RP10(2022)]|uniref:OmpA family protein n=1 Tax=Sphingomonas liriopis TaxID=2949094 RepID=A0A9X2HYX5_9SPHN|nr:OmpA family protein [Sphingomonas liriopis]MCP3734655.1 OmpA family protein [Sphingomonas liriopis]
MRSASAIAILAGLALAGCSKEQTASADGQANAAAPPAVAASPAPAPTPAATPATAQTGFDPASVPVSGAALGAFPYFGLLDGYVALNRDNTPSSWDSENQRDAAFDRYEFFDGTKIVAVEGRLRTVEAIGKGASFLQAARNYAALVGAAGGVTVFEGDGQAMADRKLTFRDPRFRARYNMLGNEKMGVYMLRTPTSEIWVEVYDAWDQKPDNYWLTIVERKALDVTARLLPAEAMKKALDATGHVALYVNFDTDKTAVKPSSQPLLGEVVKLLNADPALKLTVEGHTDDAGTPAHNQTLSQGRANAVMGALIAAGIDPARLQARGFGQGKPIADNATDDGKAKNRRVELVKR